MRSATAGAERLIRRPSSAALIRGSPWSSSSSRRLTSSRRRSEGSKATGPRLPANPSRHVRPPVGEPWRLSRSLSIMSAWRQPRRPRPRRSSRRTRTSSGARSSTTSAGLCGAAVRAGGRRSASPGCGSRPRRASSPCGGGPGAFARRPRSERRTLLAMGAVLGLMNATFYLAIGRLPLGTVGRSSSSVPSRSRPWVAIAAEPRRAGACDRGRRASWSTCISRRARRLVFAFANAALFTPMSCSATGSRRRSAAGSTGSARRCSWRWSPLADRPRRSAADPRPARCSPRRSASASARR